MNRRLLPDPHPESAVAGSAGGSPGEVLQGLRWWASGFRADEAAVELVAAVAVDVPAILNPGPGGDVVPWLVRCPRPGWWSLDGTALAEVAFRFPVRVRPVVRLVASLAVDGTRVDLGVTLASLRPEWWGPAFAALAHAAGCRGLQLVATGEEDEPGLFPWRETAAGTSLAPVRDLSSRRGPAGESSSSFSPSAAAGPGGMGGAA